MGIFEGAVRVHVGRPVHLVVRRERTGAGERLGKHLELQHQARRTGIHDACLASWAKLRLRARQRGARADHGTDDGRLTRGALCHGALGGLGRGFGDGEDGALDRGSNRGVRGGRGGVESRGDVRRGRGRQASARVH